MDNIGDWLYVVFIIIAAASSLLSSGRKKKQSKEILGQPGKEFHPYQPPVPPAPRPEKKTPQPVARPQTKKQPSPFLQAEKNARSYMSPPPPVTSFNEPEPEPALELDFRCADDLKKAVIYSEILNRKY